MEKFKQSLEEGPDSGNHVAGNAALTCSDTLFLSFLNAVLDISG